jgi:hypothetical protein
MRENTLEATALRWESGLRRYAYLPIATSSGDVGLPHFHSNAGRLLQQSSTAYQRLCARPPPTRGSDVEEHRIR